MGFIIMHVQKIYPTCLNTIPHYLDIVPRVLHVNNFIIKFSLTHTSIYSDTGFVYSKVALVFAADATCLQLTVCSVSSWKKRPVCTTYQSAPSHSV